MKEPASIFFNNVDEIYQYCLNEGYFGIIEIISKRNGPKLYLYPLLNSIGTGFKYDLLFFDNRKNALKFDTAQVKSGISFNINEIIPKNNINALMVKVDKNDDEPVQLEGYGKFKNKRLADNFFKIVEGFLNSNELKMKLVWNEQTFQCGIPDQFFQKLATYAVNLYPDILETKSIYEFKSEITGHTEYFVPTEIEDADKNSRAAYILMPDRESKEELIRKFVNSSYGDEINPDCIFVEIINEHGRYICNIEASEKFKRYSRKKQELMVLGLLMGIGDVYTESLDSALNDYWKNLE